jgi:hypothetical protein
VEEHEDGPRITDWSTYSEEGTPSDEYCSGFDSFMGKVVIFSIIAALIAIVGITIGSKAACKHVDRPKTMGTIAISLGALATLLPAFAGCAAAGGVVEDMCSKESCFPMGCDEKQIHDLHAGLAELGIFVTYTLGHGYLALILGIVSISLGFSAYCGCCKPSPAAATTQNNSHIQVVLKTKKAAAAPKNNVSADSYKPPSVESLDYCVYKPLVDDNVA